MLALAFLALVRFHGAIYSPILDCDETFNYWEPLNHLSRGFGKKTWEYASQYALRSYAYLLPFSMLKYPISVLGLEWSWMFYLVRLVIASWFVFVEWKLFNQLKSSFGKSYSWWFLLSQLASPGMYAASVSLLPNSLALSFAILATTYILKFFQTKSLLQDTDDSLNLIEIGVKLDEDEEGDLNIEVVQSMIKIKQFINYHSQHQRNFTLAIFFTSLSCFICWPFTAVLIVPFVFYALAVSTSGVKSERLAGKINAWTEFSTLLLIGLSCLFFVPYFISQIDYLFYGQTTVFSYNLVKYNIFTQDVGPELFGIEDVYYYFKNLLLNFHIIFPIAIIGLITIPTLQQSIVYKLPLVLWLVIMVSQDHKEERFLYPIYHLISLSFAHVMSCSSWKYNKLTQFVKLAVNFVVFVNMILLGWLRVTNVNESYGNYIDIYKQIPQGASGNLCVGREWFHYPSSFFLPDGLRLKFTHSSFDGMLPGDFNDSPDHFFNNKNEFQPEFVVPVSECDYFIDITQPTSIKDGASLDDFSLVKCLPVINSESSWGLNRILGIANVYKQYISDPWFKLQEDLTVIELNRKLMEMNGIIADGREMFDDIYTKWDPTYQKVMAKLGNKEMMEVCLAKRG